MDNSRHTVGRVEQNGISGVGLHLNPGKGLAGEVSVVDIGIPRGAPAPAAAGLISEGVVDLVPRRVRD